MRSERFGIVFLTLLVFLTACGGSDAAAEVTILTDCTGDKRNGWCYPQEKELMPSIGWQGLLAEVAAARTIKEARDEAASSSAAAKAAERAARPGFFVRFRGTSSSTASQSSLSSSYPFLPFPPSSSFSSSRSRTSIRAILPYGDGDNGFGGPLDF